MISVIHSLGRLSEISRPGIRITPSLETAMPWPEFSAEEFSLRSVKSTMTRDLRAALALKRQNQILGQGGADSGKSRQEGEKAVSSLRELRDIEEAPARDWSSNL